MAKAKKTPKKEITVTVTHADQIEKLSEAFSRLIQNELTPEQLKEVNDFNATSANCCGTHDFTDANVIMYDAFTEAFGKDIDINDDAHMALWNKAWDLSKKNQFKPAANCLILP